jgi:putative PEP-CTERM system TPR-repeat lipoprotein
LLAVTHLKAGRIESAEKEAKEVIEMDDRNAFAHNLMGSIYLAQGKSELAMEEIDRAIEINPNLIDAYFKKGAINFLRGDSRKAEQDFINAVEIAPEILNSRLILSRYLIRKGKYDDALKSLSEGLKNNKNDALLYNQMGIAYMGKKDIGKATELFEKAQGINPELLLPYFNMGSIYINRGEKEKAIKEYRTILDIDENNLRALITLAKFMESDGKDKEALDYYMRAKKQKKPASYIAFAEYYLRKKDIDKAKEELNEASSLSPGNIQVMDLQGAIFMMNKNYDSALTVYKNIAAKYPDLGSTRLIPVYEAQGDYENAIKELKQLITKKNDIIELNMKLVNLYIKNKDLQEAEKAAQEIISKYPDSEKGYLSLATVYIEQRYIDKALYFLERAEDINPKNIETKMIKARIYSKTQPAKALEILKEIVETDPDHALAHDLQATVYQLLGDKKAAVKKYEETLNKFPNDVVALNNLAYLYTEGYGTLDEAVTLAEKAYKLKPQSGSIMDTYGWTLYKNGSYDEAMRLFRESLELLPNNPSIHYHMALAYIKKGMNDKAEKELNEAIVLGRKAPFPEIDEAKKTLKELSK